MRRSPRREHRRSARRDRLRAAHPGAGARAAGAAHLRSGNRALRHRAVVARARRPRLAADARPPGPRRPGHRPPRSPAVRPARSREKRSCRSRRAILAAKARASSTRSPTTSWRSQRRLERTRILVRAGPALGLMGTLIPLAPGLAALGHGDVATLATDLRTAFAATTIGLLVGTVAFALTLTRTRMYTEDLTALERATSYIAKRLRPEYRMAKPGELPSPWTVRWPSPPLCSRRRHRSRRPADDPPTGLGRHSGIKEAVGDPARRPREPVRHRHRARGRVPDRRARPDAQPVHAPAATAHAEHQHTQTLPSPDGRARRERARPARRQVYRLSNGQLVYVQKQR